MASKKRRSKGWSGRRKKKESKYAKLKPTTYFSLKPNTQLVDVKSPDDATMQITTIKLNCHIKNCPVVKLDQRELHNHILKDHRIPPHNCLIRGCTCSFNTRESLKAHVFTDHREMLKLEWPCRYCRKNSKSYSGMLVHHRYYHEYGLFRCAKEGCTFESNIRQDVKTHLLIHTKPPPEKLTTTITVSDDLAGPHEYDPHKVIIVSLECPVADCNVSVDDRSALEQHLLVEHAIQKYRCLVDLNCGASFRYSAQLLEHFLKCHSSLSNVTLTNSPHSTVIDLNQLPCGYCSRKKGDLMQLISHYRTYHEMGRYKCSYYICGYEMAHTNRRHMKRHAETHFPAKFCCTKPGCCGRPFNSKEELDTHPFSPPNDNSRKIIINEKNEQIGVKTKRPSAVDDAIEIDVATKYSNEGNVGETVKNVDNCFKKSIRKSSLHKKKVKVSNNKSSQIDKSISIHAISDCAQKSTSQKSNEIEIPEVSKPKRKYKKHILEESEFDDSESDLSDWEGSDEEEARFSAKRVKVDNPRRSIRIVAQEIEQQQMSLAVQPKTKPKVSETKKTITAESFTYKCPISDCTASFPIAAYLNQHIETVHQPNVRQVNGDSASRPVCPVGRWKKLPKLPHWSPVSLK